MTIEQRRREIKRCEDTIRKKFGLPTEVMDRLYEKWWCDIGELREWLHQWHRNILLLRESEERELQERVKHGGLLEVAKGD